MKIKVNKEELIKNLPSILKIPCILNLIDYTSDMSIDEILELDINGFSWSNSIESMKYRMSSEVWSSLYEGKETDIPYNVERYWERLQEINDFKIQVIDNSEYKGNVGDKKVTISIKYE